MMGADEISQLLSGWDVRGPFFKNSEQYISSDRDNPEAPWPGYGWPLDTECYFFQMHGHGRRLCATGVTPASALDRVLFLAERHRHQHEEL